MTYCFYHKADLDGRCSGHLVKKFVPEVELFGIDYGDYFPWGKIKSNDTVYMVDFCLQPFDDMVKLNETSNLTWIDHHKSAIEEAKKREFKPFGLLDTKKSACELTWDYFNPKESPPRFVTLLGRYDVWDLSYSKDILPFQYALSSYNTDSEDLIWQCLFSPHQTNKFIREGESFVRYEGIKNKEILESISYEKTWLGYNCLCCNYPTYKSSFFNSVREDPRYDLFISYKHVKGEFFTVKLYTIKENIDVSKIAKEYGGGGHKGAAGFQCKKLYFL